MRGVFVLAALAAGATLGMIRWGGLGSPAAPGVDDVPLSIPGVRAQADARSSARAAVVLDADSGTLLYEHRALDVVPIASLTKVMSAMVALDRYPDLAMRATILPTEYSIHGANLRISPGETVTLKDLLVASIAGSANNAAFALPRVLGMSDAAFVEEMNRKAVALGADTLHFVDAAGLSPENVGSAYDVARMAAAAFQYPVIAEAAQTPDYAFTVGGTNRSYTLRNSNPLFAQLSPGTASKTGYLNEALFCAILARLDGPQHLVAVVLGHPSEDGVVREALALLEAAPAN